MFEKLDFNESGTLLDEGVWALALFTAISLMICGAFTAPIRPGGSGTRLRQELSANNYIPRAGP